MSSNLSGRGQRAVALLALGTLVAPVVAASIGAAREDGPAYDGDGGAFLVLGNGFIDLYVNQAQLAGPAWATPPGVSDVREPYFACVGNRIPPNCVFSPGGADVTLPSAGTQNSSTEELNLTGVFLEGVLAIDRPDGTRAPPLRFLVDAKRDVNGAMWSGRFVLPPGVGLVREENLRIVAYDNGMNAWSFHQNFSGPLGPAYWDESLNATKNATGWQSLVVTRSVATLRGPVNYDGVADFHAYRASLTEGSRRTWFGSSRVIDEENSFIEFDPKSPPAALSPLFLGGFYVARPQISFAGFSKTWNGVVDTALAGGKAVLDNAEAETGSFIWGSDSDAAKGHVAGDFLSGIFVWGNARDCVIKPALAGSDSDADAAMAGIACLGLALDVAMVAGPGGITAEGAADSARIAAKEVRVFEPRFVVRLYEMAKACAGDLTLCKYFGKTTMYLIGNPSQASKLVHVADALGAEGFLRAAALDATTLDRAARLAGDLASKDGRASAQATLSALYKPSNVGAADATFRKAGELYERYATNVFAGTDSNNGLTIIRNMPKFVDRGTIEGLNEGGASVWIDNAISQAAPTDQNGWTGYVAESKLFARYADERKLVGIQGKIGEVPLRNGRLVEVQNDLVTIGPNNLPTWTESKAGSVGTGDSTSIANELYQLERQMAAVKVPRLAVDRTNVDWVVGGTVGQPFVDGAQTLATDYGVALRVLDQDGNVVRMVNP